MTYCVGMWLDDGLVFMSDTRTNAGVDNIATARKLFTFENTGKTPLIIHSVKAACGCTVLKGWPKEPILPGESGEIPIEFTPKSPGSQRKYISIIANTRPATNRLFLKGEVVGI